MNSKVSLIGKKAGDAAMIAPVDALREWLREIDTGEVDPPTKMVALYLVGSDDDLRLCWRAAGCNRYEHASLLSLSLHQFHEDWSNTR